MLVKPKPLIVPRRQLYLPHERRKLPRPAPWIWIPKRFAPRMAVAFDAKANATTSTNNVTSPQNNTSLTIGAGGTLVIGVFAYVDTSGAALATASAMTWNGVSMTLVSNKTASDNHSNIYVYALVSPTTGSHTLSVSFSGGTASATQTIDTDCFSFSGTDTTSVANCIPSANVITDATNDSGTKYPTSAFTVTTASGDAACAAINSAGTDCATAAIGTLINNEASSNDNYSSARNLAVGATTQIQFNVTAGGSSPCCGVAFRIQQPGGGDVLQASPGLRWM